MELETTKMLALQYGGLRLVQTKISHGTLQSEFHNRNLVLHVLFGRTKVSIVQIACLKNWRMLTHDMLPVPVWVLLVLHGALARLDWGGKLIPQFWPDLPPVAFQFARELGNYVYSTAFLAFGPIIWIPCSPDLRVSLLW